MTPLRIRGLWLHLGRWIRYNFCPTRTQANFSIGYWVLPLRSPLRETISEALLEGHGRHLLHITATKCNEWSSLRYRFIHFEWHIYVPYKFTSMHICCSAPQRTDRNQMCVVAWCLIKRHMSVFFCIMIHWQLALLWMGCLKHWMPHVIMHAVMYHKCVKGA